MRLSLRWWGVFGVLGLAMAFASGGSGWAQNEEVAPEPTPPSGQTYIGTKKCSACHFDQFLKWRTSKHAKSFDLLTSKYQNDEKCLKCHTTGYGTETGYKTIADRDLQGTSCEACHGPGSIHETVAKKYANQKLTPDQEKEVRDSIWMILPRNACISCHQTQAHKESQTPPELRK